MITRSKMRRQLYRGGGIADLYPRQKYGIGSWVQDKKDKAVNVFRKVVPNELADIAVKAAPFVAPFNPAVAAAMRGIGRFDQRGSMSDAFKQAAEETGASVKWGAAWSEGDIRSYSGTAEDAMMAYVDLRRSQGRRPFIDAPHFELMQ